MCHVDAEERTHDEVCSGGDAGADQRLLHNVALDLEVDLPPQRVLVVRHVLEHQVHHDQHHKCRVADNREEGAGERPYQGADVQLLAQKVYHGRPVHPQRRLHPHFHPTSQDLRLGLVVLQVLVLHARADEGRLRMARGATRPRTSNS